MDCKKKKKKEQLIVTWGYSAIPGCPGERKLTAVVTTVVASVSVVTGGKTAAAFATTVKPSV